MNIALRGAFSVIHLVRILKMIIASRSIPIIVTRQGSRVSTLRWRHNDHAGVSNHQPYGCLLHRLFRRRWKETSKLRVTGLCAGNSPGPVNSPHKGPVTRKMFPFDDVIMNQWEKTSYQPRLLSLTETTFTWRQMINGKRALCNVIVLHFFCVLILLSCYIYFKRHKLAILPISNIQQATLIPLLFLTTMLSLLKVPTKSHLIQVMPHLSLKYVLGILIPRLTVTIWCGNISEYNIWNYTDYRLFWLKKYPWSLCHTPPQWHHMSTKAS